MPYKPDPEDNLPPWHPSVMGTVGTLQASLTTSGVSNELPEEIAKKTARLMDKVNAYRDDM